MENKYSIIALPEELNGEVLWCDQIVYREGLFFVDVLSSSGKLCRVSFDHVYMVRISDESYRVLYRKDYNVASPSIIKINQSEFIEWFNKQTIDIYNEHETKKAHYFILIGEELIDVISDNEPIIKLE